MYRLVPLLDKVDPEITSVSDESYFVEGSFEDYIIVSVPESCNLLRAEEIKAKVMGLFNKPVIVLTHNISLLKATKLTASEANLAIKEGEYYMAKIAEARESVSETITKKEVPNEM